VIGLLSPSCKKDNDKKNQKSEKYQIVAGTWKQVDIVLGVEVSVKVDGQKYTFPAGTSMISDPYMAAFGVADFFIPTQDNVYEFASSGTYNINGETELILPMAGNSGTWALDVYDAVLKFTSADKKDDPHWINAISSSQLNLSITVDIPGLGTAPLNLILEKQ
jgi:hypothetical protein